MAHFVCYFTPIVLGNMDILFSAVASDVVTRNRRTGSDCPDAHADLDPMQAA